MKKPGFLLSVAIAASSAVILTSCGDYVGKEKTHPLFIKAGTAKNAGNYLEAAKYFEEFLTICPKSAETHFRLASLYGDNLDEPLKAVYHYRKYLELAPNDTTNADDINGFTELAKKRLYEKLKEEYKDNSANIALNEDLEKTKEQERTRLGPPDRPLPRHRPPDNPAQPPLLPPGTRRPASSGSPVHSRETRHPEQPAPVSGPIRSNPATPSSEFPERFTGPPNTTDRLPRPIKA